MKRKLLLSPGLFFAPVVIAITCANLHAADGTWSSVAPTGNWNDAANWTDGTIATGATNSATFGTDIAAATTITQDFSGLQIGNLTFSDNGASGSAWTVSGSNSITLGDGVTTGGTSTLTSTTGATISSILTGLNGVTKAGTATLNLIGSNTYTGATLVTTGTLVLSGANASSGFTVASGATLGLRSINLSATRNITGAGNLSKDISTFGDSSIAGTNNNYTGSTTVNISTFTLASGGVINGTSSLTVQGQWSAQFKNLGSITTAGAANVNGYGSSGTASASGIFYNGNVAGTTPGTLNANSMSLGASNLNSATVTAHGGEFFNYANSSVNLTGTNNNISINGQGNALAGGMVAAGATFTNAGSLSAQQLTLNASAAANTTSHKGASYIQTGGSTTLSGFIAFFGNGTDNAVGTTGNDSVMNISGGTMSTYGLSMQGGTFTLSGGTLTLGGGGMSAGVRPIQASLGAATVAASANWNGVALFPATLTDSTNGTTFNTSGFNIGFAGILSGTGKLVKSGTGTLTLSAVNAYSGNSVVNGGELQASIGVPVAGPITTFGTGSITANAGTTLRFKTGSTSNAYSYSNAINLNDAALIYEDGVQTLSGNVVLTGANAFSGIWGGKTLTLSGVVSGGGSLSHGGFSTMTLSGANTYSGGTSITGGTLVVANAAGLGTGAVTVSANGNLSNTVNFTNNIAINTAVTLGLTGGNFSRINGVISGDGGISSSASSLLGIANTYTGKTRITGGFLCIGADESLGSVPSSFTADSISFTGGYVSMYGSAASSVALNTNRGITLTSGTGSFDVSAGQTLTVNGVITGPGNLNHNSANNSAGGTLVLAGANTYTGATSVTKGTLAGTGSSASALTVSAPATLSPGAGIGTWSATSAAFASGATFKVEINSTTGTSDKLVASGAVGIGLVTLSLSDLGSGTLAGGTKLNLIDYTGGSLTGTFAGYAEGTSITINSNTYVLHYADSSKVTLTVVGSGSYQDWADAYAGGQAANLDFDKDGVPNGVEYFMGEAGNGFTANPQLEAGVITWTKDPNAAVSYVVETSIDLDHWDPAVGVNDTGTSVIYSMPVDGPKTFVRLRVTTP